MAIQTDGIRLSRGAFGQRDDLRYVTAALHMKAARPMAFFALDALLGMKRVREVLCHVGVAGRAGVRAYGGRTRYLRRSAMRDQRLGGLPGQSGKRKADYKDRQNGCDWKHANRASHRFVLAN
jgi:hypothetical protein